MLVTLFAIFAGSLTGCNGAAQSADGHDHAGPIKSGLVYTGEYPIKTLCTTGQVAEMARKVGGEHLEVTELMGPGVDPHLYRPEPSDRKALRDSDAIIYSGMHLEGKMTDLFVQMARKKLTYPVTAGVQERADKRLREPPEFDGMYDPHLWHNVALWSECAEDLAQALAEYDPSHADEYLKNVADYKASLVELDEYCRVQVAKIPKQRRVLVTAHDAFGYFGDAYGIEVHGLKGVSSEAEKDLSHQEDLQKMIIKRNIPAVFVESAINERTVLALVEPVRDAGHDLKLAKDPLYADVLGPAGSGAETFEGMIRHNVDTIVRALSGE